MRYEQSSPAIVMAAFTMGFIGFTIIPHFINQGGQSQMTAGVIPLIPVAAVSFAEPKPQVWAPTPQPATPLKTSVVIKKASGSNQPQTASAASIPIIIYNATGNPHDGEYAKPYLEKLGFTVDAVLTAVGVHDVTDTNGENASSVAKIMNIPVGTTSVPKKTTGVLIGKDWRHVMENLN